MKKSLCLVVCLLIAPLCANAGPMYLQLTESDPGGPNNVVLSVYDSLVDMVNFNAANTFSLAGPPGAVSVRGLAYDGSQYLLWTESDPGGLNNIVLTTYDSLADLASLNAASSFFPPGPPGAVSVSGLAYDGSQYLLWTESDPGGLNNVVLTTYDSLADLASLNSAGSFFPGGLDPAVSVSGITFVPEQAIDVPEPWPLALLSFGLIGFAVMRCRRLVPIRMRSTAIA